MNASSSGAKPREGTFRHARVGTDARCRIGAPTVEHCAAVAKSKEIDWTSGVYQRDVAVWAYQTAADWLTMASRLGTSASVSREG